MGIPAVPRYPGIAQIKSCSVTLGHGTVPTGFRITIAPQPSNSILDSGTFRLEYNNQFLDFPECRVDSASFVYNGRGQLIELRILDRRWKWALAYFQDDKAFGRISGEYNVRREDGTIRKIEGGDHALAIEDSERTPVELATLLLKAAGEEIAADALAHLPNDVRPYVNWDVANPMYELSNLADLLGCRVVLGLDNKVRLKKLNQGVELPTDLLMEYGANANFYDTPDEICLITGPVVIQHDFELEEVGMDVDGDRKPFDDLSYKPTANGFDYFDVLSYFTTIDDEGTRTLAERSLFREYRIKTPFTLPIFGEIKRREQITLLGTQVFKENVDGVKSARDALVYGVYFRDDDAQPANSAEKLVYLPDAIVDSRIDDDPKVKMIVREGFAIDTENWLVRFSDIVYKQTTGNGVAPAQLRLRTSCQVRFAENAGIIRKQYFRKITGASRPYVLDLRRDDIRPTIYFTYDANLNAVEAKTNDAEIALEVEHYLSEAAARYAAAKIPQTGVYAGWRFDVNLDGAIQSITWMCGANEDAKTIIERCHDTGRNGIPYALTRVHQKNKDAQRKAAIAENQERQIKTFVRAAGGK